MADLVLQNATLCSCAEGQPDYGLINDAAVVLNNSTIAWAGPRTNLPKRFLSMPTRDMQKRLLTPSLIDCHTHIVHGGHRASEFEQRLQGVSYADIAVNGGGIVSTMKATRAATVESLIESALPRLDSLIAEGLSVIEIKSGYGLDTETELNMLRAARALQTHRPVVVKTSFLGAHAVPPEFNGKPDDYIDTVCIPTLIRAHSESLVDAVDGFCESIAFTPSQVKRVFECAASLGLPVKLHAEQLSLSGGAVLASEFNALSADHLEYLDSAGARAMAASDTVAVLLPGAYYTLKESRRPPVDLFRQNGVPMAVATDSNPGSSPLTSILLAMNLACTLFGLTPEEALLGTTRHAAKALGIANRGVIADGHAVDIACWNCEHPAELSYRIGFNPLAERITKALDQ